MKKTKSAGTLSQKLRAAEEKREETILERIRQDVLSSQSASVEESPTVATKVRNGHRLARR
jgi:hypothetical protein